MTTADLQRFSLAAQALSACETPTDLPGSILAAMTALADSDIHAVHTIDPQTLHLEANSVEISARQLGLLNHHIADHPLLDLIDLARRDGGGTRRWSDATTLRQFRHRALYHDFFRPLGVRHQMASTLAVTRKVSLGLAFNRRRGDYRDEEVQMLQTLVPHIRQLVLRMIGRQEVENALALRGRAHASGAALVVDRGGKIWFVTDDARRWLRDYFPGRRGADHGGNGGGEEELPGELLEFLNGKPSSDAALTVSRQANRLVCTAGPLTPWTGIPAPHWMHHDATLTWVRCLHLREESDHRTVSVLQGLGLTPRESEVLRWLMEGKRTREIALILSANPHTVRTHVQRILEKLGVETRTAAAARAAEILGGTGLARL